MCSEMFDFMPCHSALLDQSEAFYCNRISDEVFFMLKCLLCKLFILFYTDLNTFLSSN